MELLSHYVSHIPHSMSITHGALDAKCPFVSFCLSGASADYNTIVTGLAHLYNSVLNNILCYPVVACLTNTGSTFLYGNIYTPLFAG